MEVAMCRAVSRKGAVSVPAWSSARTVAKSRPSRSLTAVISLPADSADKKAASRAKSSLSTSSGSGRPPIAQRFRFAGFPGLGDDAGLEAV